MNAQIVKVEVRNEHDIVLARRRARLLAELLGFEPNDCTRIATSVSEIARNAFKYAGGGSVAFRVEGERASQSFVCVVGDSGPGIPDVQAVLDGRYRSSTGMGLGIVGARRLMDSFGVESSAAGTVVRLGKRLPGDAPAVDARRLAEIAGRLLAQRPADPFEEVRRQNQELLTAMDELRRRTEELEALNRELEETNRGVAALYAELDEKATHLSRANEMKTRFLSNMSHEFRTPINSILSLSRILLDRLDGDLTEEQEKQVGFVRKAAEDLSALVNDLLDLAKIEAGKADVRPAEFEIAGLFGALRGMFRPMLANRPVDLIFEAPSGLPPMTSDEGKISQILRNFVSNALKFTESGEIRVTARSSDGGRCVLFSVADTGVGIPCEYHEAIFEEYVQAPALPHTKEKGTGLGLPLSKRLAELLGGSISMRSAPGEGSVFSVLLPADHRAVLKGEPRCAGAGRALVVDDEEAARYILKGVLTGMGYEVLEAADGETGVRIALAERPDVLFLDLAMPGMDGFETIARLKDAPETRDTPVIVVSSKRLDETERRMLDGKALTIISKEIASREEVAARIGEALAGLPNEANPTPRSSPLRGTVRAST